MVPKGKIEIISSFLFYIVNPFAADGLFDQYDMLTKRGEMTKTLAHGHSFYSTQDDRSNEYEHDRV